jgi:hypothetical protein
MEGELEASRTRPEEHQKQMWCAKIKDLKKAYSIKKQVSPSSQTAYPSLKQRDQ